MSIIELTQARRPVSPSDAFANLAMHAASTINFKSFDVYGDFSLDKDSSWLRNFEALVADYLGIADALFLPSGVMAQMIALSVNRELSVSPEKDCFLCHYSSHLLIHEQNSYSELLKMTPIVVPPESDEIVQSPLTSRSINPILEHSAPSSLIVECPHREIGGKCTPFEDLKTVSLACRERGIRIHMDGARLWEASAFYCTSNEEKTSPTTVKDLCALFDSVYVSFYKGLGGLTGAMLLGDKDFIARSRIWLRRFGGNLFTLAPYSLSAYIGFKENVDSFASRRDRLRHVIAIATRVAEDEAEKERVASLVRFDPPVPVVSLIHVYLATDAKTALLARDEALRQCGIAAIPRNLKEERFGASGQVYFEMNMGPANIEIADSEWEIGWRAFITELRRLGREIVS